MSPRAKAYTWNSAYDYDDNDNDDDDEYFFNVLSFISLENYHFFSFLAWKKNLTWKQVLWESLLSCEQQGQVHWWLDTLINLRILQPAE